jgi:hypothetical protein
LQPLANYCNEYARIIIDFGVSLYIHLSFFSNLTLFTLQNLIIKFSEFIYSIIFCSKLKSTLQNHLKICEKLDLDCSLVRLRSSHSIYFFWLTTVMLLSIRDRMFVVVKNLLVLVTQRNWILWLWVPST